MKKYLLLLISIISFYNGNSQISHQPKPLVIVTKPNGGDNKLDITFTNNLSTEYTIYWQVIKDNSWKANWETYICDLEFCYGANIDKSNISIPNKFKPGAHKFEFHFDAKGQNGNGNVMLKLFTDKNFTQEIYSTSISLQSTNISHTPAALAINAAPSSGDNKLNIMFNNSIDSTYTVYWKVIKDPQTWKAAWETYICDLEFCYGNNLDQSNPSLANKFPKGNHLIEFHFFPNGVAGNTTVGFKLFADKNFTQEIYHAFVNINSGLSSTNNISEPTYINVSPNPVHQNFVLKNDTHIQSLDIINIRGEKIQTLIHTPGAMVDVSSIHSGMYIIKLYNAKGENTGISKFIKL